MTRHDLKEKTKSMAAEIRNLKTSRRKAGEGFERDIDRAKSEFRHHHVAACFLRGTPMTRVENNPDNLPDPDRIERILADVACSARSADLARGCLSALREATGERG